MFEGSAKTLTPMYRTRSRDRDKGTKSSKKVPMIIKKIKASGRKAVSTAEMV
jgi:hypothetical protein